MVSQLRSFTFIDADIILFSFLAEFSPSVFYLRDCGPGIGTLGTPLLSGDLYGDELVFEGEVQSPRSITLELLTSKRCFELSNGDAVLKSAEDFLTIAGLAVIGGNYRDYCVVIDTLCHFDFLFSHSALCADL